MKSVVFTEILVSGILDSIFNGEFGIYLNFLTQTHILSSVSTLSVIVRWRLLGDLIWYPTTLFPWASNQPFFPAGVREYSLCPISCSHFSGSTRSRAQLELQRVGERQTSSISSDSQNFLHWAGRGQNQEPHLGLPQRWQAHKHLGHLLLFSGC